MRTERIGRKGVDRGVGGSAAQGWHGKQARIDGSKDEDAKAMNSERLSAHLQDRPAEFEGGEGERGTKVVGYFPGNYVPEEIIYAAGAVPLCLSEGGNLHSAAAALSVVPSIVCPFARAPDRGDDGKDQSLLHHG